MPEQILWGICVLTLFFFSWYLILVSLENLEDRATESRNLSRMTVGWSSVLASPLGRPLGLHLLSDTASPSTYYSLALKALGFSIPENDSGDIMQSFEKDHKHGWSMPVSVTYLIM